MCIWNGKHILLSPKRHFNVKIAGSWFMPWDPFSFRKLFFLGACYSSQNYYYKISCTMTNSFTTYLYFFLITRQPSSKHNYPGYRKYWFIAEGLLLQTPMTESCVTWWTRTVEFESVGRTGFLVFIVLTLDYFYVKLGQDWSRLLFWAPCN